MELVKLGILDFGIRSNKIKPQQSLINLVIEEAILIEKLGFSRIWYTEHYTKNTNLAWLSPEILIPLLAAYTKRVKIGIAGTLSLYKEPILIASNFKLLSNLFKNRIDLGFAKGIVSNEYQKYFSVETDFDNKRAYIFKNIKATIGLLKEELSLYKAGVLIPPLGGDIPALWNLTSSPAGYNDSLELGINCSRTLCLNNINTNPDVENLKNYRDKFFNKYGKYPQVNIVVAGSCQQKDNICKRVIEENQKYNGYINLEKAIIGTPSFVYDSLLKLSEVYMVEEIMFYDIGVTKKSRKESFINLAKIFNLTANSLQ